MIDHPITHDDEAGWQAAHAAMVEQLRLYQIKDQRILAAMSRIQRHRFIPADHRFNHAEYGDLAVNFVPMLHGNQD